MSGPRVLHVAIVGSGPAGLYALDAILRHGADAAGPDAAGPRVPLEVHVDVWDRLPAPYGLVRYGVAPDHAKMKGVAEVLRRGFDAPHVRFVGGVGVGAGADEVPREDLLTAYDAVVWATGASVDRHLDVPGEELPGSCAATDLVAWYSGHPDATAPVALDDPRVRRAVVLGVGNVAVDVARVLLRSPEELRPTDVPRPVLQALRASRLRVVEMVGRRGPQHATWTTKELRELGDLDGVDVQVLEPADVTAALRAPEAQERRVRANLEVLAGWAARPSPDLDEDGGPLPGRRLLRLRFWRRAHALLGDDAVTDLRVERTAWLDGRLAGTGEVEDVPADVVVRAVGYRAVPIAGLPFDEAAGVVPHDQGRVLGPDGAPCPGEYVTGWLKRGPHGVIGTNKADAAETVRALLEDVATGRLAAVGRDGASPAEALLARRGLRAVSWSGWLAIDAAEVEAGRSDGAARVKVAEWERLRALGQLGASPAPPAP